MSPTFGQGFNALIHERCSTSGQFNQPRIPLRFMQDAIAAPRPHVHSAQYATLLRPTRAQVVVSFSLLILSAKALRITVLDNPPESRRNGYIRINTSSQHEQLAGIAGK